MNDSVITERGQVSVPAGLRRAMGILPGQKLHWEQVSDREIRVSLHPDQALGPLAVLGYARRIREAPPRRTADWMRELREGE
ncbi:MAG: AbrB/MazE/SpoVT family DNA-binding domain-containing protein [Luteolibacter sp.]